MKKIFSIFTLLIILTACNNDLSLEQGSQKEIKSDLSNMEEGFPEEIVGVLEKETAKKAQALLVTAWEPHESLEGVNVAKDVPVDGISIKALKESKAQEILRTHYDEFSQKGYLLFLTNLTFDDQWQSRYDLALIKAENQYEIVEFMNTEAPNYNLNNKQIIEQLKKWEESLEFRIVAVDGNRIEAQILKMPDDVGLFAKEIFDFCPDTVWQGTGSLEELVAEIKRDKYFWLWWD